MYFKITCTQCGKDLKVREDDVGRNARCPYCRSSFEVPPSPADAPIATPRRPSSSPAAPAPAARQHAPPSPRPVSAEAHALTPGAGTHVSLLISGAIGLGAAVVFCLAMLPLRHTGFGQLFLARGWVPFVLVFLTAWSAAILLLKWRKIRRQKDSMLFDLLPAEHGADISARNLDKFVHHVRSLPAEAGRSFLVNRVLRGLEYFRVRRNNPEVAQLLASQSNIDAAAVESSYSIVKVFIWAIPILGFIGTVMGISQAVGSLGGNMDVGDIDQIKSQLGDVTAGLAVAFDTTLIALVMSLLIMFPASALQKQEEDLLNWVDEYCNENLLKRLSDGGFSGNTAEGAGPRFDVNEAINRAIDAAMVGRQGAMIEQLSSVQQQLTTLQSEQVEHVRRAMLDLSKRTDAAHEDLAGSIFQTSESLRTYFGDLERGLRALNDVLGRLGEKQIVIQMKPPEKRGWKLFGRRNGKG